MSFAKNIPNSFDKMKLFNIDQPNIYFFEISNEGNDEKYVNWCKYITFVSHVIINCSYEPQSKKEIDNFLNLLYDKSTEKVINSAPSIKKIEANFSINCYDEKLLPDKILSKIIDQYDSFFPHETAENYCYSFLSNKQKPQDFAKEISKFKEMQTKFYTQRLMENSLKYIKKCIEDSNIKVSSLIQQNKIVDDSIFKTEAALIEQQTRQFIFVNSYQNFWDKQSFIETVVDLMQLVRQEYNDSTIKLREIIEIKKLIQIVNQQIDKKEKSLSKQGLSIFQNLKSNHSILCKNKPPNSVEEIKELSKNLHEIYDEINDYEEREIIQSIQEQLYDYLNKNPISSDKEYGSFYTKLFNKYYNIEKGAMISNCFQYVLDIREVDEEFQIKSFNIEIDKEFFELDGFKIDSSSFSVDLSCNTTCHQLYELVQKHFKLEKEPFYITKYRPDKSQSIFSQCEVFDNDVSISKLSSKSFRVNYGFLNKISTRAFLQSMIIQKLIKIDRDFFIRTCTKESKFNIDYDKNHKGWFNVVFDIKTPTPEKSFGQDGAILIYLTLSEKETAYIKQGNSVVHQSFQNGKWITEKDPVFISYPKCNTAVMLLRHCSQQKLVPIETQIEKIMPPQYLNIEHSRNWDNEDDSITYYRGGKPYILPVGYKSKAINVNNSIFQNNSTCVGFHGTKCSYVTSIIENGFILPSKEHEVEPGHFRRGKEYYGIKDFATNFFARHQ